MNQKSVKCSGSYLQLLYFRVNGPLGVRVLVILEQLRLERDAVRVDKGFYPAVQVLHPGAERRDRHG